MVYNNAPTFLQYISTSFTGALSRHHFARLILSKFCSIDLIPGHKSLK